MMDVTKLQTVAKALPKIARSLPQHLEDLTKARDAIIKMASPATAAFVTKVAGKSTPFGVHAAIFGGGFVLGAVTTAFLTPMKGDELRAAVKGEATRWWANLTGKAEDVVEEATVDIGKDAGTAAARAAQTVNAAERRAKRAIGDSADRLTDSVEAAAEATRGAVVTMPAEPLDELTKEELYERAKAADIDGRSQMDKHELIDALRKTLN